MTYRSRSGGPQRQKPGQKKKQTTRKLHHPPPPPIEEDETALPASLPISVFTASPSDIEILKLVHHALRSSLDSPRFNATVQRVKGLLYDKKWLEVFTDPELLDSYAGRWVPSRACCYRELFAHLGAVRELFIIETDEATELNGEDGGGEGEDDETDQVSDAGTGSDDGEAEHSAAPEAGPSISDADAEPGSQEHKILSLGGGASSELLGVAAMVRASLDHVAATRPERKGKSPKLWTWTGIDIGAWSTVVDKFKHSLMEEWELTDSLFKVDFIQGDLLASTPPTSESPNTDASSFPTIDLANTLTSVRPDLTTILFTLTELMSQSRPATISLLRTLTAHSPEGGLLLVADSASDISEFEMGSSGRKWPIYMILDTILLGPPAPAGTERKGEWECVRKEDSRWYRLPPGVGAGWPVKLENTRYWYRLYRRV